jgi:hypothetical protein
VSDPLYHPPVEVLRTEKRGSLTPQMHVAIVRRNRAQSVSSSSAPPVSDAGSTAFVLTTSGPCQVLPGNCVHIGERAFALNQTPETVQRSRHLPPLFQPARFDHFVVFVVGIATATASGHQNARLSGGPRRGQATPLRSVPDGLRA